MAKAIQEQISFYSKNYLTPYCEVISYEGFPDFKSLCDFNPYKEKNIFQISAKQATFAFNFIDYFGQYYFRTVDTIVLQNCNIKAMKIYYYQGETAVEVFELANNEASDLILNIQEVATSRIEFVITDIFGDYTGIQIGQLRILNHLLDLNATTETSISFDSKENSQRSYNGDLYAWRDYSKWSCQISASGVDKNQYDILARQIYENRFMTIIPWQNFERKDIYEINVNLKDLGFSINRFSGKLSLNIKGIAQENASI